MAERPLEDDGEILLDVRWLLPPEPLEKVLAGLPLLRPGQHLRLLIHLRPYPLYGLLEQMGYTHETEPIDDGCFAVRIRPKP